MSATVGYKCPSCGAPISFDSAAQKMKCEYCDSQLDAKTLEDYRQALEAEEMEPQPVNEWSDEESADMVCYICNSCGGAVITDKTTSALRDILYQYHRKGLDEMALSVDKGRATVTQCIELLKGVYDVAPMSVGLSIFKDSKLDELVNIYSKAGSVEKEKVYELLYPLYPTENDRLQKIKTVSKTN